jgi:hypothetical protein
LSVRPNNKGAKKEKYYKEEIIPSKVRVDQNKEVEKRPTIPPQSQTTYSKDIKREVRQLLEKIVEKPIVYCAKEVHFSPSQSFNPLQLIQQKIKIAIIFRS